MDIVRFPIVPICEKQLKDVKVEDRITNRRGQVLYRTCDIENAGGGYDEFRKICKGMLGVDTGSRHFIVQVRGCTFECNFCYVTESGIWGRPVSTSCTSILSAFRESGCKVLHLMGGAPALYLSDWKHLICEMKEDEIFHSDFLLNEGLYRQSMDYVMGTFKNQLHAVSMKPFTKKLSLLQLNNLMTLVNRGVPFYITYTGMSEKHIDNIKSQILNFGAPESVFNYETRIPLRHYAALD